MKIVLPTPTDRRRPLLQFMKRIQSDSVKRSCLRPHGGVAIHSTTSGKGGDVTLSTAHASNLIEIKNNRYFA